MPRIKNIDRDFVIHDNDKVVGSDAGNAGATRNYSIGDIAAHIVNFHGLTSNAYILKTTADEKGEFHTNDNSAWQNITSAKLSNYVVNNTLDNHVDSLSLLKGRDIIIVEAGNKNVFGVYDVQGISHGTDFTDLTLHLKHYKGSPTEDKSYIFNAFPTDKTFTNTVTIEKDLKRTITTVTPTGTSPYNHECDLSLNDNFKIEAVNGANSIDIKVTNSLCVGQTGNILIHNPSSVGSLSFQALPSYIHTPFGATVNFDTTADRIAVISYIVLKYDAGGNHTILINYIGDFS